MKLAIVGSREYPDLEQVRAYVRSLPKDTVVISGGADGVDEVAVDEAHTCGLAVQEHIPEDKVYGPMSAPYHRNRVIVENCDELVAFWGPIVSSGTSNAVGLAARAGKLREVVRPKVRA